MMMDWITDRERSAWVGFGWNGQKKRGPHGFPIRPTVVGRSQASRLRLRRGPAPDTMQVVVVDVEDLDGLVVVRVGDRPITSLRGIEVHRALEVAVVQLRRSHEGIDPRIIDVIGD